MEQVGPVLREFGFPAAVAFFVLWRLDATLRQVRDELRELRQLMGDRRRNLSGDA